MLSDNARSCILFHFYIKPQLYSLLFLVLLGCILFHFYIKPQPRYIDFKTSLGCILFHFYIKPQQRCGGVLCLLVVSYSISTSNHNLSPKVIICNTVVSYSISTSNHNADWDLINYPEVVSYSISTSNHNRINEHENTKVLYLIPFLHQTTTGFLAISRFSCCILFHFYIKPQLSAKEHGIIMCCILFHFYIKPQLYIW